MQSLDIGLYSVIRFVLAFFEIGVISAFFYKVGKLPELSDENEERASDALDGQVCSKKQRSKQRKILLSELLQDFASNTTLHGLGYIAKRGITTVEKIFWLVTFCVSVGICLYQIRNVWSKWVEVPVIVSINEELIPVSEVPFPSVTICPQWKVFTTSYEYAKEKDKLDLYKEPDLNVTDKSVESVEMFEDVSLICDKELLVIDFLNLTKRNYSGTEAVKNIKKATEKHLDTLYANSYCSWQKSLSYECDLFSKVYTKDGICYNFNGLSADEIFRQEAIQQDYPYIETEESQYGWSMENGYDESTNDPYPRRGRENGADPDLVLIFRDDREYLDRECNALHSGYKVYVQHPADMPQSTLYHYALVPEQTSSFALKFSVVSTSPKLKDYSPEIRGCYYGGERYLRYFQIYTENNCRMECLSNYTYSLCGCVGFYMPHHTNDRICTIHKTTCVELALEILATRESPKDKLDPNNCNCLPLCTNVEYDAEILKTEFNLKTYHTVSELDGPANYSYSRLEMYFKSPRFLSMRRSELFGTTDFIANCGGLLGLFLGFSFLSIVEIVYFITLRIWCAFKTDVNKEKQKQ